MGLIKRIPVKRGAFFFWGKASRLKASRRSTQIAKQIHGDNLIPSLYKITARYIYLALNSGIQLTEISEKPSSINWYIVYNTCLHKALFQNWGVFKQFLVCVNPDTSFYCWHKVVSMYQSHFFFDTGLCQFLFGFYLLTQGCVMFHSCFTSWHKRMKGDFRWPEFAIDTLNIYWKSNDWLVHIRH